MYMKYARRMCSKLRKYILENLCLLHSLFRLLPCLYIKQNCINILSFDNLRLNLQGRPKDFIKEGDVARARYSWSPLEGVGVGLSGSILQRNRNTNLRRQTVHSETYLDHNYGWGGVGVEILTIWSRAWPRYIYAMKVSSRITLIDICVELTESLTEV